MGLTGTIINVHVHMDSIQRALPQLVNETITIAIALNRQLQYKNAYQTGKVCVKIVMQALKELCWRHLYKTENVHINKGWDNALREKNNSTPQNERHDTTDDIENE